MQERIAPDDSLELVERRANPRVPLVIEVGLETDNNFYTGLTEDISLGGVFIATRMILPVGRRVRLWILIPGATKPMDIAAEVRWRRRPTAAATAGLTPGMGLRFIDLGAPARVAIEGFLERREALFYEH